MVKTLLPMNILDFSGDIFHLQSTLYFSRLSTPLLMHQYSLSREDATMYSGIIFAADAVLAICGILLLRPLAKR